MDIFSHGQGVKENVVKRRTVIDLN